MIRRHRRPPGLLIRTVTVTFVTATALLAVIFFAVMVSVRKQVRNAAQADLESSQRMFAAIQLREQRSIRLQATNVAESPTLKAAVDTYAAESRTANEFIQRQLLNTITAELANVADRVEADAIVVVDTAHKTLAAAGPMAPAWPPGHSVPLLSDPSAGAATESVAHIGDVTFQVVSVPLTLSDGSTLGSLYLVTNIDRRFAQQLGELAHAQIAIVTTGEIVASTLSPDSQSIFEGAVPTLAASGTLDVQGESNAYRRLFVVGDTAFYALTSIDT